MEYIKNYPVKETLSDQYEEAIVYAVINHLHLTKPVVELQASLEQEGVPLLLSLPGFQNFYLVQTAEDRAAVIILWDSAENAANGAKSFGPTWFAQNIAPYLASEQQRSGGEVIVRYQE